MEAKVDGLKIDYSVRESEEASRPRIDHELGDFTVIIPQGSDIEPKEIISRKEQWISKKRKEFIRFKRKIPERNLEEGGKISLLGNEKEIKVEKRRSNTVEKSILLAEHLVERTSLEDQLEKTLREEAREVIEGKVREYSPNVSEDFDKIFIRDQKTRWGSCSSKGNLNFNWRLILGPENVLEYVVVHELVHLEHKNHGDEFWSTVRDIFPNYKEANRWLSKESAKLVYDKENIVN